MSNSLCSRGFTSLIFAVLWSISAPIYGALTESTAAEGLSGASTAAPGDEVQIFSMGVTGDGSTQMVAINVTLSDLSSATGMTASNLSQLKAYTSTDATLDGGDSAVGSVQTSINIGSGTSVIISDTPPNGSENFYIIAATVNSTVTENHAFRVGFASAGAFTSGGPIGTVVTENGANTDQALVNSNGSVHYRPVAGFVGADT